MITLILTVKSVAKNFAFSKRSHLYNTNQVCGDERICNALHEALSFKKNNFKNFFPPYLCILQYPSLSLIYEGFEFMRRRMGGCVSWTSFV